MARVHTFEQLFIWQEARRLTNCVYRITARSHGSKTDRCVTRRAAISVMANIAEGFERDSQRELARFLAIAKASAGELRSRLYAAEDLGYVPGEDAQLARQQAALLARQISALRKRIRADQERGADGGCSASGLGLRQDKPSAGQAVRQERIRAYQERTSAGQKARCAMPTLA